MISKSENEANFMGLSIGKLTNGVNLLVILVSIGFIAFTLMVVLLIKYRSQRLKKKNSICEETVESGILSPDTKRVKITKCDIKSNTDNSDSSDDQVLYEKDERYRTDRVQPKRQSLRPTQQSVTSSMESEMETIPSLVVSVVTDGTRASVALIKAKNLRRSGHSSTDRLIPEGVFARIYPTYRTTSTDSSQTESEQSQHRPRGSGGAVGGHEEYFESPYIKSKKSKLIKFSEKERFDVLGDNFPIRLSVYEYDKQRVRYNIGNCFLNIDVRDNYHTKQIIELSLYKTLYKAKSAAQTRR
ncbi:unnamed protein product [Medioppia subpectinata]|uniref:Uncharacterized protein n=1 Tax=Medioppia subpectinata TaxID=1979941 RepID=A0A7R9Q4Y7_9ACAR|nr:unnamed protein product [Medioppia subpectinata]CAG2112750.1 unnamed protein product [Medioppia subpectinata]